MKNINHKLAALVGLAAISAFSISCSSKIQDNLETSQENSPTQNSLSKVTLNISAFDIGQSNFPMQTPTRANTSDPFKRLAFKVFNSNGTAVFDTVQHYTQDGFGTISFLLPDGTYTFVAVGHNVSSDKISDTTVVANIESPLLATLPEPNVPDVFCATSQVIVQPAQDFTKTMTLTRSNSKFSIVMSDAIPAGTKLMEFVLNAAGAETDSIPSISPTTGYATSNRQYIRTFDVSKAVGKKNQSIGMNLLLTDQTQTIDIMATAYNDNGDVIISRYLEDIPMRQNRITTATGVFFNAESTASITVDTTWNPDHQLTY